MKKGNVLIIEDEKKTANMLKLWLDENEYEAEVAYDGQSGLKLFRNRKFNFALLDINLPDINGHEICRLIRLKNSKIPIIILSALGTLDDKVEGYSSGADDYLSKPFQFKELLLKMNVLLKRSSDIEPEHIITAGPLEMNLDTKKVLRSGIPVALTAKEFQLLEYFVRHKNKVLSRSDIVRDVWNIDFKTGTNIIDVYINYIRNKLDKPFDEKLIHTETGMGFILKIKE